MTGASIRYGLLALVLGVSAMAVTSSPPAHVITRSAAPGWKTGYWVWAGEPLASARFMPDTVYVEAATRRWPRDLPAAAEYVVVQRMEPDAPLTLAAAMAIAERYDALVRDAASRVRIVGLQIDYDSPTRSLRSYATFLTQLRQHLPDRTVLSITALLDWFTPHSDVAAVIERVDEFVPQFYDAAYARTSAGIAQSIDQVKWAPVFNAFRVPYRIGISSFGRVARRRTESTGHTDVHYFRDASPFEFVGRSELARATRTTSTGELIVQYEVRDPIGGQPALRRGDSVEITFPTEDSVRAAYESAKQFGGYCAGVVAFRWPGRSETVTLSPDDVGRVMSGARLPTTPTLEVRPASCIERACQDLYLDVNGHIGTGNRTIAIRATTAIDLFFPNGPLRPFRGSSKDIVVRLPAYAGLGRFYLGRTITSGPVDFLLVQP